MKQELQEKRSFMGLLDSYRKPTRKEWIEEQKMNKSKDCELCKYKRKITDTPRIRCNYHKVGAFNGMDSLDILDR